MITALGFFKTDLSQAENYLPELRKLQGVERALDIRNTTYDAVVDMRAGSMEELEDVKKSVLNTKGIVAINTLIILYNR